IFDGWSLHATLAEIFTLYVTLLNNEIPPNRPEPITTFRDFVQLERKALESPEHEKYWVEKLNDCVLMEFPQWHSPSGNGDIGGQRIRFLEVPIPYELSEDLKRLARRAAVPIKSVLLAAHLKVMSLLSGNADVLTGLTSHGRPEELDGEQARGLFLNT